MASHYRINKALKAISALAAFSLMILTTILIFPAQAKLSDKSAKALAILRAGKKERIARDKAREEEIFRNTATIVRIVNRTTDRDVEKPVTKIIEHQLRNRGFFVKDFAIAEAVIKNRHFKAFKSSEGLARLGEYLKTGILVFVTIEKCLVSTFADDLYEIVPSGQLSIPDKEFVEVQLKISVFDVTKKEVRYSHRDRQFIPIIVTNQCTELEGVFQAALHNCISNLLMELNERKAG